MGGLGSRGVEGRGADARAEGVVQARGGGGGGRGEVAVGGGVGGFGDDAERLDFVSTTLGVREGDADES